MPHIELFLVVFLEFWILLSIYVALYNVEDSVLWDNLLLCISHVY